MNLGKSKKVLKVAKTKSSRTKKIVNGGKKFQGVFL